MAVKPIKGEVEIEIPPWHEGQHRVYDERRKTNIVCAHRGWFKSAFMMKIAIEHLATGQDLGWYGSTQKVIDDNLGQFHRAVAGIPKSDDWFNQSKHTFTIPGCGTAHFYSMEVPDNARGPAYSLVLGDECGMWDDSAWSSVVKMVAKKKNGTAWLCGTPNPANPNNWFYNLLHTAKKYPDKMASWIIPALGADIVDDKVVVGVSPMTRYANPNLPFQDAEDLISDYEMEHFKRKWQIEVLCKFISDSGGQFENVEAVCTVPMREIPAGSGHFYAEGYETVEKRRNGWFQTGIDIAMVNDFTVISVLDLNTNCQCYQHRFCPGSMGAWDMVYEAIVFVRQTFSGNCYVDCTKDGSLVTELPRRGCTIIPVFFNQKNKAPMLDHLSSLIATNKVKLFNDDILKYELSQMQRKQMTTHVKIEAAKGAHDDTCTAAALMCIDVRPMGQIIAVESSIEGLLALPNTSPWRDELW